jgi:hypothetical protein
MTRPVPPTITNAHDRAGTAVGARTEFGCRASRVFQGASSLLPTAQRGLPTSDAQPLIGTAGRVWLRHVRSSLVLDELGQGKVVAVGVGEPRDAVSARCRPDPG